MSPPRISRNPDLKRLRDEGYDVSVQDGFLVLRGVPYVTPRRTVERGWLISTLDDIAGDRTVGPLKQHVAMFRGETPCDAQGAPLAKIVNSSEQRELAPGLTATHSFSSKPREGYPDYYSKMTTYARILASEAAALEPGASAQTYPVVDPEEDDSPFHYEDTASSRANIVPIARKLDGMRVAIIGLGGTGGYVLDLVAKTRVAAIHLFDGDIFRQYNAFRAPGAPSRQELQAKKTKVAHFAALYGKLHKGIVPHEIYVDESNFAQLREMDFVFVCLDRAGVKRQLAAQLVAWGVSFIDVGIGVHLSDGCLIGHVRVTTVTSGKHDHVGDGGRIPYVNAGVDDAYGQNIQLADLNALNAALAVIRWKRHAGIYYADEEREHHATYVIGGNMMASEDLA